MRKIFSTKWICFPLALITLISSLFLVSCADNCAKRENATSYEIQASLEDNVLTAEQTVCFFNCYDNAFSVLKFNIFGNAFRKNAIYSPISNQYATRAYYDGYDYGNMEITTVRQNDKDLQFEICGQDKNILAVSLENEVFPDESVTIYMEYKLTLAKVKARTGITLNTVNLGNFYPILCGVEDNAFYECVYYANGDPFYSEVADYKVTLTCDCNYVVASSGNLLDEKKIDDKRQYVYEADNLRSFALVLSKNFKELSQEIDGVLVKYYYYLDESPEKSLEYAIKSINYFSKTFGKYPYKTYSVVQTGFIQGGMEYSALVMISTDLDQSEYGEVIVHETAHQWWQTAVGNNEIKYGFLDEGLTEYSVVLFYENHAEYGVKRESMVKSAEQTFRVFCSVYDKVFGKIDTTMNRSLDKYISEYEYVNIAYIKPVIMYDTLRVSIGDERFFKGLKKYFEDYKFKNATPDDLVGEFEKIGAGTNGFFASFFDGTAIIWLTNG